MRVLIGDEIVVKNAKVTKILQKNSLVTEHKGNPIDFFLEDPIHGKILCSCKQNWVNSIKVNDIFHGILIVQKRGFDILVAKKIKSHKIDKTI